MPAESQRDPPSQGKEHDDAARESHHAPTSRRNWRTGVWLGTLSTVIAIATGMFTLRDQIFPKDAGTAAASVSAFQVSVGDICAALNGTQSALPDNARNLATRLKTARTANEQRNAVLDSWNQVLGRQQHELAIFEGLDVPETLKARVRETGAAWNRIVVRLRAFAQQLNAASSAVDLDAAVRQLPAIRTAIAADGTAQVAGLTELGGGRCTLNTPPDVQAVSLPATSAPIIRARSARSSQLQHAGTPAQRSDATQTTLTVAAAHRLSSAPAATQAQRLTRVGPNVGPVTPAVGRTPHDSGRPRHPRGHPIAAAVSAAGSSLKAGACWLSKHPANGGSSGVCTPGPGAGG